MPIGSNPALTPEVLVLDRGRGVDDLAGQLVVGDQFALEVAEASEFDLAGPVVDDRLLLERDVRERGHGVGQPGGVLVVRGSHEERTGGRHKAAGEEHHHEDDGDDPSDGGSGTGLRPASERPAMALTPRETGLHEWPHDSIGGVNDRSAASQRVETTRRAGL